MRKRKLSNMYGIKKIAYVFKLLRFAYQNNPMLCLFPIISTLSIFAELMAMMSLLPLSLLTTGQALNVKDPIVRVLTSIGIETNPKNLIFTFCILFVFRIVSSVLSQSIALKYGKKVLAQLGSMAFGNIVRYCQLEEIEQKSIGDYISLAGDESFRASNIVIEVHQLVSIGTLGMLYFFIIFWYSPMIAVGLVLFLTLSFLLMLSTFRKTHRLGERQIQQSKSASSVFLDGLNGLRTVRSFFAENFVVNNYSSMLKNYTHTLYRIDFVHILIKFVPIACLFAALIGLLTTNLFESYTANETNFVLIITMILFLMRLFPVIGQALNVFLKLISDAKAGRDVTEMLSIQKNINTGNILLKDKIQSLAIHDLNYAYKDSSPIFQHLYFNFEAGKSYALVGPSGMGKSTFFNILSFLIEVQTGDIKINNVSYKEYDKSSLRKKLILVEQQSIIFNDTILNNITFGDNSTLEDVIKACKIACIDDFISQLPEGYQHVFHYQGQNISGGQRQRIGIARAILRNPDVLLLDEVTSALDEETKYQVIKSILEYSKDKIVIFITHDPAVMELVDININLSQMKEENFAHTRLVEC